MIHNSNNIILVLMVPNISGESEKRCEQFHKALQDEGTRKQEFNGMQLCKTRLSIITSQLIDAITAISLSMEDANKANKRDSLMKSKEKEEEE